MKMPAEPQPRKGLRWWVSLGMTAQAVAIFLFLARGPVAIWSCLFLLTLALACVVWLGRTRGGLWEVALVTFSLGGLGMVLGAAFEAELASRQEALGASQVGQETLDVGHELERQTGAVHEQGDHGHPLSASSDERGLAHHGTQSSIDSHNSHGLAMLLGGSTLGMLLLCIPACVFFCPEKHSRWCHGLGALGMLLGMLLAGSWAGPGFSAVAGPAVGGHFAMVVGMALGAASGTALGRHLAPPIEPRRLS